MKKNIIVLNEKSAVRSFGFCIIFMLAVIQLFNFPAYAASFDCNKASTKLEHFICEDEELNEIDGLTGSIYYDIRKQLGETDKEALKKDQISWIKERNKCNTNKNCLIQSYNKRIDYLESVYSNQQNKDHEINIDCSMAESSVEIIECNYARYEIADREMDQIYREAMVFIEQGEKEKLSQAQRAWLQYRDKSIEFISEQYKHSTSYGSIVVSDFKAKLTEKRVLELKYLLSTPESPYVEW